MCLSCEMSQGVDALTDEVETIWISITIQYFEIEDPLEEELVGDCELFL